MSNRIAWLDVLIGTICMSLAAIILILFSIPRERGTTYRSGKSSVDALALEPKSPR